MSGIFFILTKENTHDMGSSLLLGMIHRHTQCVRLLVFYVYDAQPWFAINANALNAVT